MTIQSSTSRISYAGDGVTQAFPVPFVFFDNGDLSITQTDTAGTVSPITNATISGATVPTGGLVTLLAALPSGYTLTIFLAPEILQLSHYISNAAFPAETLEEDLDHQVQIDQYLQEQINFTIRADVGENAPAMKLPPATTRANKALGFDASGNVSMLTSIPAGTLSQASIGGYLWPQTTSEAAAAVTPSKMWYAPGDVRRYGADPTGVADCAAAIQAAINVGTIAGEEIYIPSGTFRVVAGTAVTGEFGAAQASMVIKSNMHIRAEEGATIKMGDGQSTAGAQVRLLMFFTDQVVSNISVVGLTMDMNGDNNQLTAATSAGYTMSHFCISGTPGGVAANANDVLLDHCKFINSPGTCCVLMGQTNTPSLVTSKRWIIRNCTFFNNGLYTYDHTNIYGWADHVLIDGNHAYETAMALDGKVTSNNAHSQVFYEVHGSDQRVVNNKVSNYYQAMWLAGNYTTPTTNIVIANNNFGPLRAMGIDTQRTSSNQAAMNNIVIKGNNIHLTDDSTSITLKCAMQFSPNYAMSDLLVEGNYALKDGTTVGSAFIKSSASSTAAQVIDRVTIKGNQCNNFATGVQIATTGTNGYGVVVISGNVFHNTVAQGTVTTPCGVITSGAGQIGSIMLTENVFNVAQYGIYMSAPAGSVYLGLNEYITMASAGYAEPGSPAITFRKGPGFGYNRTALAAPTIASSNTIAPNAGVSFVSGTTTLKTITVPLELAISGGSITLIPTGLWVTDATGNIAIASTAVVSKALILTYDVNTNKWYPSY